MLFDDIMLCALALGVGMLLREARRARDAAEMNCGDEDELTPMTVQRDRDDDRRRVN